MRDTIHRRLPMLKLLLVEDNARLRPVLGSGLDATGAVQVVAACGSGEEALDLCLAEPPGRHLDGRST